MDYNVEKILCKGTWIIIMFFENYESAWTKESIRHIATPSDRAKSTFYYVQEVGRFKTLKQYYTERSGLDSYLMIYTLSGVGHLTYAEKNYRLTPGNLLFIDCNNHHYYKTDENALWEILWVHFNGSSVKGYYEQFSEHHTPVLNSTNDETYPYWMSEILKLHANGHLDREVRSSLLLTNCLTQLLIDANTYNTPIHLPKTIQAIQTYIDHHYTEIITLESLSHQFGISKYHLSRLYKRYTGFSPIDYQISLKVTMAKNLLQFTNKSIEEISYQLGIPNISHFINMFKRREALTPLQFRKKWLK